jgi:hypothetical protein
MDVVLVLQYEAMWWQEQIHRDEVSAGFAVPRAFGAKIANRSVVPLVTEQEQELV